MKQTKVDLKMVEQPETKSSYTWQQWAKAGMVFTGTVGSFLALKSTGSFGLLANWWQKKDDATSATLTITEHKPQQFVDVNSVIYQNKNHLNSIQLIDFKEKYRFTNRYHR